MSYQGFISRLSKEEQDFYDIKNAAAEFYKVQRIPQEMERALNELFLHKPEDVHGYLVRVCLPVVQLPDEWTAPLILLRLLRCTQYTEYTPPHFISN